MPNLNYDPNNPSDILGQPIEPGDTLVWSTTVGKSAAINVGILIEIMYKRKGPRYDFVKCDRASAEKYTLKLQPVIGTGNMTIPSEYRPNGFIDPLTGALAVHPSGGLKHFEETQDAPRPRTIQHVKNVVKIDPSLLEGAR